MASTSSSSIQKKRLFKYDVFLSFRGEDTRKNFVDHLYHALDNRNIHTYKDDERITKGKRINDELIASIKDSRLYIIVFSKNYASSSWCLDELVQIMEECRKTTFHTAYPVFYDVEPTEVRKQSGSVGGDLIKLEKQYEVGKWRAALKEAVDLAGWELKNTLNGHEAKFIQKLVETISLDLRFIDSGVDGKLIGMESRVKDVVSALQTGMDDFRIIGIKGMGGAGKTTLARAVFDHISVQFEGKSFVENVREVSKASLSGLKKLQKQILTDVLNDRGIKVSSVHDGKNMMQKMMCGRKVFVVLDDVDNIEQLEALAGEPNWFKPGSRIIITTRDEQVLVAHRVNSIRDVNLLLDEEAVCLFSRYAFGKEIPIQGYEKLSRNVVSYAAGLPLTLRVLGSFLCGKNELEWKDAIDRLKTIPMRETLEKLELSYISLEDDYKEIFLDVACIMEGWGKELGVEVLESCGFHARNGLRVLEQKSLITVSIFNRLGMHDHIKEMGKNIVRRLHPSDPNRHSRLWIQEEIDDILANDLGTEATRCLIMEMNEDYHLETFFKCLGNMVKLRVLVIYGRMDMFKDGINDKEVLDQCLPNALRYLVWVHDPFECLMKSVEKDHLVGLHLHFSRIKQFWKCEERKVLKKLKFLHMNYSYKMRTLDLEMIPNIETLNLSGCRDLVELNMPLECSKLKTLDLEYCKKLRTLKLAPTPDLETLSLAGCYVLSELCMPFRCPKLKTLSLNCSKLRTLKFGPTLDLETLSIQGCDLLELYMPNECPNLKSLCINSSKLRILNLGQTSNLEILRVEKCPNLIELNMPFKSQKLKSLILKESKLRTLDLGLTPNLERLDIKDCFDLVELHSPIGCLEKLVYLNLSDCLGSKYYLFNQNIQSPKLGSLHFVAERPNLKSVNIKSSKLRTLNLGKTSNLETLRLEECSNLIKLNIPFGCPKLKSLNLIGASKLRTLNIGLTASLEMVVIEDCFDLVELHRPMVSLEKLVCLNFSNRRGLKNILSQKIQRPPDSICMLKHLKHLKLESCLLIEKLPENLGQLWCLEDLYLTDCIFLWHIPKSVCELKRLKYFHLPYCMLVEKLPEELGRLKCLKELNIEGAGITHLPQSILGLEGLRIIGSRLCIAT